jgi:hypothetical protein|eukprot:gnl/Ergobibamus_cyprinoides/831.p1 GENE.gnl/Ergobibamus_cyprinoides/831~~gnl/Ergobibamus_cyprinoides/831.p1  ORF type:complete len:228 (-),score=68.41 gnl/Ergobibamus_cyprinoides/831:96-779(-)
MGEGDPATIARDLFLSDLYHKTRDMLEDKQATKHTPLGASPRVPVSLWLRLVTGIALAGINQKYQVKESRNRVLASLVDLGLLETAKTGLPGPLAGTKHVATQYGRAHCQRLVLLLQDHVRAAKSTGASFALASFGGDGADADDRLSPAQLHKLRLLALLLHEKWIKEVVCDGDKHLCAATVDSLVSSGPARDVETLSGSEVQRMVWLRAAVAARSLISSYTASSQS